MPTPSLPVPAPPAAVTQVAGLPFRALSALRGSRIFHPQGLVCTGTWNIETASPLAPQAAVLQPGARLDVVARASRGAGLPESVGDIYGIAVRLTDAGGPGRHQDVLANTSLDLPLVHHVFLPAPHWYAQVYSSCLPYVAGARPLVIGWMPPDRPSPGTGLAALASEIEAGRAHFGIGVAAAPFGRFTRIGTLALDAVAEGRDLSFDPVAFTGGGLQPTGLLNRLRGPAYRASQLGRGSRAAREAAGWDGRVG